MHPTIKQHKRNLVICVVGDCSYHRHWLNRKKRDFDLMLVYYGKTKNKFKEDADYYLQTSGLLKLENIAVAINKYYDVVQGYDAIFMPDDDMRISISSINYLFKIFHQYDLDLAQPTIGLGLTYHPAIAKTIPGYILRYSNFVDVGCPIFKKQLLMEILPLFTLNRSGNGIDHLWSKKCKDKKMAIIDCVYLVHLKKFTQLKRKDLNYYERAKKLGVNLPKEFTSLNTKYKIVFKDKIYGGVKFPFPVYFFKILAFWLFIISNVIKRSLEILHHEGVSVLIEKLIDQFYLLLQKKFKLRNIEAYFKLHRLIFKIKNFNRNLDLDRLVDFAFKCGNRLIAPVQIRNEIRNLLEILNQTKPRHILEIGTQNGGTLFLFSQIASKDASIISLDLPGGNFGEGYSENRIQLYKSFAKSGQEIHLLRADSHKLKTLEELKSILKGNKLDFLFIDGDHSYKGVKQDFEMYSSLVKKGGIVAFHDIVSASRELVGGVPRFWKEIKSQYKHREIIGGLNQKGFGIGLVYADENKKFNKKS
jgi:predicted O-methyltransferase YrrM